MIKNAQSRALKLASMHTLVHFPGENVGENLFMMRGGYSSCDQATTYWYEEFNQFKYNFNNPEYTSNTGHATQVVWVGSNELGCAAANSTNPVEQYIVCLYRPPGNIISEFKTNVLPPKY